MMERRSADIGDELVCAAPAVWAKSRVHTISPMDGRTPTRVSWRLRTGLRARAAYRSRLFLLRLHQSDWMEVAHHEFWNSHYCVRFVLKAISVFHFAV